MAPREQLLASAARALYLLLGVTPTDVRVNASDGLGLARIDLGGPVPAPHLDVPPVPPGWPESCRWFSPYEEALLKVIPPDKELSAPAIARILDPQADEASKELRALLNNLVERGFLSQPSARGYRRLWPGE